MRAIGLLVLLVLALAGCGGSERAADEPPATTAAPPAKEAVFAFDRDADLEVTEGETSRQPRFTAKAMSYASPGGDRVSGIVLVPPGDAAAPGVIFMHGAGGSRVDFLGDVTEAHLEAERDALDVLV